MLPLSNGQWAVSFSVSRLDIWELVTSLTCNRVAFTECRWFYNTHKAFKLNYQHQNRQDTLRGTYFVYNFFNFLIQKFIFNYSQLFILTVHFIHFLLILFDGGDFNLLECNAPSLISGWVWFALCAEVDATLSTVTTQILILHLLDSLIPLHYRFKL
jgi:hypothetical protein